MSELPGPTPPRPTAGLWRTTAGMLGCKVAAAAAVAGVVVLTARELEPSGRGVFVLLLTLASFTLLLCSFGLSTSARIHLVSPGSTVSSEAFFGLSLAITVLQMTLCIALGVVILPLVDVRLSAGGLALFGVFGGTVSAIYFINAALNAFGYTTAASAVDAAGSVMQLLTVGVLFVLDVSTVMPYLGALAASNGAQLLVGLAVLGRRSISVTPRYSHRQWARLVRTGLPSIPLDAASVLTFRLDRYIVGGLLDPAAVGVYSVAATAPEFLRMPILALSQPIFHRLASGSASVGDFQRTRRWALAGIGLLAGLAFLVAPAAVRTLFGSDYEGAITPLRILLLAEFGIAAFFLDTSSLAAGLSRVNEASIAALAGLVLVTVADVMLIPLYGLAGAAWASVVAYSGMGLAAHLFVARQRPTLPSVAAPSSRPS